MNTSRFDAYKLDAVKIVADAVLFFASYLVQKKFIFRSSARKGGAA